jgi:hypothetical protein
MKIYAVFIVALLCAALLVQIAEAAWQEEGAQALSYTSPTFPNAFLLSFVSFSSNLLFPPLFFDSYL